MAKAAYPAHVGHILITGLQHHCGDEVLHIEGASLTGGDVLNRMSQFIQAFDAMDIGPGSTIGVLTRNVPEVLYVMGVGWVRGLSRIALHPMGSLDDHAFVIEDAGITTLLVDAGFAACAEQLLDRAPGLKRVLTFGATDVGDDLNALADAYPARPIDLTAYGEDQVLSLAYTGGTTGKPKGVIVTAGVIAEMTKVQLAEWEWPARGRFLFCSPLSHAGASFFLPTLLTGGTCIVLPAFEPETVLRSIEKNRINSLMLVPSMLYALLDHPDSRTRDLSSLETIYYGASAINPTRLAEAIERFGPIFAQFYGQSEAPMAITYLRKADHQGSAKRLASCGRPSPFVTAALLDAEENPAPPGEPGEICVSGRLVTGGYWNRPEDTASAFSASGWLHTGDIAREDEDGFWYIVDRTKDLIVTGGFNVFPREIEDVIAADPAVAQVAVIGTPDEKWGEAVTALLVLREGIAFDDLVVERIKQTVRRTKGSVHVPKRVLELESIPVTALGKPDKKALRARFWTGDRAVG